jgi:Uma2 family endonuclease
MTVLIEGKKTKIPKPKFLTYEDYARLTPPDSGNYELHNGKIIYMPTPTPLHQRISRKLSTRLDIYVEEKKLGEIFTAPMDTVFNPIDTFQPDILFISNEKLAIIGEKKIEGAPDFIIEIKSPGNPPKELAYKKYVYETSGVREYWLINPDNKTIFQYENSDSELVRINIFTIEDVLKSFVIEGFTLKIADLFS